MRVKNRKCIRRLSFKSLWASRKRNIIAICAIALTTLMFMPVILIIPVFLLLGWLIPAVLYHAGKRQSIVENLREL